VGYHVYLRHGTSVCYIKTRYESGTFTSDLTTTVVYSYKLPTNDAKPAHHIFANQGLRSSTPTLWREGMCTGS